MWRPQGPRCWTGTSRAVPSLECHLLGNRNLLKSSAPIIADIIYKSITSSTVPTSIKHALVTPILTKPTLDRDCLNNFRSLSDLHFLAKVLEKVMSYLNYKNMWWPTVSMTNTSRHTNVLTVQRLPYCASQYDLLLAADEGRVFCLVLLDSSAAFDTIDHQVLLCWLSSRFHVSASALSWFRSYLNDRYQSVRILEETSESFKLQCRVPQGSVLGPRFFML